METTKEVLARTLRLTDNALKYDPHELYHAAGEPSLNDVFRSVVRHLCYEAVRDHELTADEIIYPRSFLYNALTDTAKILHNSPDIDTARLPQIARHPQTIKSIATLALRSEAQMRGLIAHPLRDHFYGYDQDMTHVTVGSHLHIPERGGCPFAQTDDRTPNPTPIFAKVIALTGDLIAITNEHTA